MAVTLTKLTDGKPAQPDSFPNALTVKCPRCERKYRLGYSEGEWHRVKALVQAGRVGHSQRP